MFDILILNNIFVCLRNKLNYEKKLHFIGFYHDNPKLKGTS